MIEIILLNIGRRGRPLYIYYGGKCIYSPQLLEDVENIDMWLREIELWQCVAEVSIKQQGPTIYLSLPSKIR